MALGHESFTFRSRSRSVQQEGLLLLCLTWPLAIFHKNTRSIILYLYVPYVLQKRERLPWIELAL
jgi:hypothetical protein